MAIDIRFDLTDPVNSQNQSAGLSVELLGRVDISLANRWAVRVSR